MKYLIIAIIVFSTPTLAQETDATDLSRYELFEEGQSTPTLEYVEELEDRYKSAIENEGCASAIPKIVEFYTAANFASNIIRRGNEPYYDARRDDQESIARDRSLLNELVTAENATNSLIYKRNEAWVSEAKCLVEIGDKDGAVTRLVRALERSKDSVVETSRSAAGIVQTSKTFSKQSVSNIILSLPEARTLRTILRTAAMQVRPGRGD